MINVNYQKRKNQELFKCLEKQETLFLSNIQNYNPIYKRFFSLNDTNYNSINLNNTWYISSLKESECENKKTFLCNIKNIHSQKTKERNIFFKMAPLLDPYKYLIGKYDINDPTLFQLPFLESTTENTNPKFLDYNNSAYVDGFFLYLSSNLINAFQFSHGVDYYGAFLAIKNDYQLNVFDDLEYLSNCDFFNKNKNILYTIDDYDHILENNVNTKLKPLNINHTLSMNSVLSLESLKEDIDIYNNVFTEKDDMPFDLMEVTNDLFHEKMKNTDYLLYNNITSVKSNSTCSSRASYTSSEDNNDCNVCNQEKEDTFLEEMETEDFDNIETDDMNNSKEEDWEDVDSEDVDSSEGDFEEEVINVTISKFPVQVICMENCENTLDDLILNNDLNTEEWYSIFMQIIMILITYQKAFAFTHNDLHTNNVMYITTTKKYIYYLYNKTYYKVPTFGKIFKIIDFGRSIYKFNGKLFCSDSFQAGEDAATQYNTEPYFNDKKARLEPNYSFDLCRLACSIFDYLIEDLSEIPNYIKTDPIKKLIYEWCLDDNGINILYKNNGADRYPDFKLYKMIARIVHQHTPQAQLERKEFKSFMIQKEVFLLLKDTKSNEIIDIDAIPSFI